jgi:hypothetical protein
LVAVGAFGRDGLVVGVAMTWKGPHE